MLDVLRNDVAPLLLRIGFGGLMLTHGIPKLLSFSERMDTFADPLGIGSPMVSLSLTIFAEVVCALAVIFGLFTRLASIPLVFAMVVAAFVVHANDPWPRPELAMLYAVAFLALMTTGGGRIALDTLRRRS
jgi:putative oxidoreductase